MRRRGWRGALVLFGLLATVTVSAQVRTPGAGRSSDLFLTLVNQSTGYSEVIDIGPVDGLGDRPRRWALDGGYRVRLGQGRLTYQLVAADLSGQGPNGFAASVAYLTAGAASIRLMTPRVWNSFSIVNAVSVVDTFLAAAQPNFKARHGYLELRSKGTQATNWGPLNARPAAPGRELGLAGFDATGEVGRPLTFYRLVAGKQDYAGDNSGSVTPLGEFLLTGARLIFTPAHRPAH